MRVREEQTMKKAFIKGIIVLVFLLGGVGLTGCGLMYNIYENMISNGTGEPEPGDLTETGAWETGTFYYDDYRIDIEGPEVGHPSPGTEWSTFYELDDDTDVFVDFICIDGSLEDRISELENEGVEVAEGVIWDNDCYFYMDEVTNAMIELGEDVYLQVELRTDDGEVVEISEISDEFALTIGSKFGY